MPTVNIYLTYAGDCEAAFSLYRSVFGGAFSSLERYREMPVQEGVPPLPAALAEKILHVALPISAETILYGSDTGGAWAPELKPGNNFSINVDTGSREEADRIFAGLSAGGQITMPMGRVFWGSYFGMCTDRFGVNWMVGFDDRQQ